MLTLAPGERRELLLAGLQSVSTSTPTVATAEVTGDERFLLTAVAEGTTTLSAVTDENGRRTWQVTVRSAATDEEERLEWRARLLGRLKIATQPMGARVFVDGRDTGRLTPVLPARPLEVPIGRHLIHFELGGRRSQPQLVVVTEGDNPVLRAVLP